jgi:hypothetical protein
MEIRRTEKTLKEEHDHLVGYCRKLGHTVPFSYCRIENRRLPCSKIYSCWFERIPIQDFIQRNYTPEEMGAIFARPQSKLETILDIAEQIRARGPMR